jgi:hypothetical protein
MTPRRGRHRHSPYVLTTRNGRAVLRIYLPDGRDVRQLVPDGWTPENTFGTWLREYHAEHPETALPPEWALYLGAAGPARLPGRAPADPATRAARAHVARTLAPPAPDPTPPPAVAWETAAAGYVQALWDGWHPPGPSGRARRPDSIPTVRRHLARIARLMSWTTVADLAPARIHTWTEAEEHRATRTGLIKHASICTWRSYLRAFALWCHQVGHLPTDLTLSWPRYSRAYHPREARCTTGDLDIAIAAAPETFRKGAPCRVILTLMRWTGMRRKGLARLPRGAFHLDTDPPYLEVDPATDKARRPRLVPLNVPCVTELRSWFDRHPCDPGDLPFGRRRPDGSVYVLGDAGSWTRLGDRLGLPRNLDGTGGMHRARKAAMSAMLDRPGAAADGAAASWRNALGLTGVSPVTLDTYYRRSTLTELDAAKLAPPVKHGRPLQLAFAFTPSGAITAELRHEDGVISRATLPDKGEDRRRVLALVADVAALAADGLAGKVGLSGAVPAGIPSWWEKSASRSYRRLRNVGAGGRKPA